MARRKPPSEIYIEWERLVFQVGYGCENPEREPTPEQVDGWNALYAKVYQDGNWLVSADDARLVTSLGHTIAMRQFRNDDAMKLVQQLFSHPDAATMDDIDRMELKTDLGFALILAGQIDQGLSQIVLAMEHRRKFPHQTCLHLIRNKLIYALFDLGELNPPAPQIVNFIANLLRQWPGQKRKATLAERATTNGDLIKILQSTFPAHESKTS